MVRMGQGTLPHPWQQPGLDSEAIGDRRRGLRCCGEVGSRGALSVGLSGAPVPFGVTLDRPYVWQWREVVALRKWPGAARPGAASVARDGRVRGIRESVGMLQ